MQRLTWLLSLFGLKLAFAHADPNDEDDNDEDDDGDGWEPTDESEDNVWCVG